MWSSFKWHMPLVGQHNTLLVPFYRLGHLSISFSLFLKKKPHIRFQFKDTWLPVQGKRPQDIISSIPCLGHCTGLTWHLFYPPHCPQFTQDVAFLPIIFTGLVSMRCFSSVLPPGCQGHQLSHPAHSQFLALFDLVASYARRKIIKACILFLEDFLLLLLDFIKTQVPGLLWLLRGPRVGNSRNPSRHLAEPWLHFHHFFHAGFTVEVSQQPFVQFGKQNHRQKTMGERGRELEREGGGPGV